MDYMLNHRGLLDFRLHMPKTMQEECFPVALGKLPGGSFGGSFRFLLQRVKTWMGEAFIIDENIYFLPNFQADVQDVPKEYNHAFGALRTPQKLLQEQTFEKFSWQHQAGSPGINIEPDVFLPGQISRKFLEAETGEQLFLAGFATGGSQIIHGRAGRSEENAHLYIYVSRLEVQLHLLEQARKRAEQRALSKIFNPHRAGGQARSL